MALKVKEDIIKNTSGEWDLSSGLAFVRHFTVFGVEGNPTDIVYNAFKAFDIPKPGEKHPTINVQCVSLSGSIIDKGQVKVIANYRPFEFGEDPENESPTQVKINGVVQSKTVTESWVNGKLEPMLLKYKYRPTQSPAGGKGTPNPEFEHLVEAEKDMPVLSIAFSRKEDKHPFLKAQQFLTKVNKFTWNLGRPRTWFCSRLEGNSSDGGETYTVDYEFLYNPDGWEFTGYFRDPVTGEIPPDIEAGPVNGGIDNTKSKAEFILYEETNFTPLKLSL